MIKSLYYFVYASLLGFSLVGCSTVIPEANKPLYAIYERLWDEAKARNIPLKVKYVEMKFGDLEEKGARVVGLCSDGDTITIDGEYWDRSNDLERELLVFHEGLHCGFNFHDHITDKISIMNPSLMPIQYYEAHRDDLITEAFNDVLGGQWELQ